MIKKIRRKKAFGFVERTLLETVSILKETVSNEEIASRDGFLQRCNPSAKCLSAVALLICALLSKSTIELAIIYAVTIPVALISSVKLSFYLKRTLLFIPLFSLFIILPALFSVVTPGEPLVTFKFFHFTVSITRQGIDSGIIFFLRVLSSVSIATLLILTTRSHVLLKVLRNFGVPKLFVMTIGMTYRYIHLLLEIIQSTYTAIKSRVGFVSSKKEGRRLAASTMAGLWLKSYRIQSQVYDAMISRGYTGEPKVLDRFSIHAIDFILILPSILALSGTIWLNHFLR